MKRRFGVMIALAATAVAVAGCGSSSPSFTDVYGYTCTISAAFPGGYCPADHGLRITYPATVTGTNGRSCPYNQIDIKNGRCP
ncbi:MAG: hypothetical protein WBP81_04125 [Solirubrobacteraceae bacterium]